MEEKTLEGESSIHPQGGVPIETSRRMAIRDLPVKQLLVVRNGKPFWQRYHYRYRPEFIPDAEYSRAVEEAITQHTGWVADAKDVGVASSPRIVIPSEMRDWESAKQRAFEADFPWLFPMRLHLTDEYLQRVLSGADNTVKNFGWHARLGILYTYSSPIEALRFLVRLGDAALRRRKPMTTDDSAWTWLAGFDSELERLTDYRKLYEVTRPAAPNAPIWVDIRLAWRHRGEWFPLLVDVCARQIAWQVVQALQRGTPAQAWARRVGAYRWGADEFVRYDFQALLALPPVDRQVRRYLPEDARDYYQQVYEALRNAYPETFLSGEKSFRRYLLEDAFKT
ncbi:MAG: hypothetical protein CFK48_07535 [Armatimonadetes bacterium CP1_7O]|nr:MAG: hypothetical protein CFK48_07535 [Armatimonadetes bacterium CP1_7O]